MNILNISKKKLNFSCFIREIFKAYTEGIYCDSPANRKLGRVGMTYQAYAEKVKKEKEGKGQFKTEVIQKNSIKKENFKNIHSTIESQFNSLKKNNDYITFHTNEGIEVRIDRNKETGKFISGKSKNSKDSTTKTFMADSEESLLNNITKYLNDNNYTIKEYKDKHNSEVNQVKNADTLIKKMQEAKDQKIGTVKMETTGNKSIYISRKKAGRWLKDFESFSVRDAKFNVIYRNNGKTEKEFKEKLLNYLQENKIELK